MSERFMLSASICALSSIPYAALAQSAPATAVGGQAAQSADARTGLEEIIVTAQKRSENLQKVPIAVTSVSAETLQTFHVTNNAQLAALTPGLNFTQSTIAAQPWIRGIGNASGVPGNEPAVSTYVDGVYRPSPVSAWFSYNGIQNIQVLKGPQGTLFGRNATGGIVSITTKQPAFDPSLDVTAGYGNYDTLQGSVYATGGLTDNLAADVSVYLSDQQDGFGRDLQRNVDAFKSKSFSARSKLYFRIADNTSATLSVDYDHNRSDQGIALSVLPGTTSYSGFTHAGGYYDTNSVLDQSGVQKQGGVALNFRHEFGGATFTNISSFRKLHSVGLQNADPVGNNFGIYINARQKTFTQEANLQSPSGSALTWIAGVYYFHDEAGDVPTTNYGALLGSKTSGTLNFGTQTTDSYAAYGQTTIPLWNEAGHLTLGVRYTNDKRSIDGYRGPFVNSTFVLSGPAQALAFNPAIPRSVSAGKVTYRVAYDHKLAENFLGYASVSRGFKSGNYVVNSPTAAPTRPQTLDAYEVGFKSEWADRRLRINGASFYYKFHDLQVKAVINGISTDANAASAEYYGADLDVDALVTNHLELKGSLSWVHATYLNYVNAPLLRVLPNGNVASAGFGNVSGKRVAFVDPFNASLSMQYHADTEVGRITLAANGSYQHGYYNDPQNLLKQEPHTLIGASVGWRSNDKSWEASVWGQNLLDKKYFIAASITNFVGQVYSPASPRTFGVTLSRHF